MDEEAAEMAKETPQSELEVQKEQYIHKPRKSSSRRSFSKIALSSIPLIEAESQVEL
jgi:hypothetical protein